MDGVTRFMILLPAFGLLMFSCASVDQASDPAIVETSSGETDVSTEEPKGHAHDIMLTSEGHILVAKWYGGVAVSNDAGSTWSNIDSIPIREFTIDQNGRIWGYHRWHGIHEPSEATLTYSDDEGYTWETIELEPAVVMPEAFITQWHQTPIIVASDGQLWQYSEPEKSGWSAWSRLGNPTPEDPDHYGYVRTGIQSERVMYVASKSFIWMTRDLGSTWEASAVKDIQEMCCDDEYSYAVSGDGVLYQAESGSAEWETKAAIADVELVLGVAAIAGRVYVAGETYRNGRRCARVTIIEKDSTARELSGLKGPQAYSVRIGPDGNAWAVSQEAYREGESGWLPIWTG